MKLQTIRGRLLASTMIGGAVAAIALPAFAQQATAESNATVKEVVVTGSRIPRPNTTAVSPVQTVGQAEFKMEGTVNAESLLNNLPSVTPSAGQYSNNGASGIATVDLRGFGATRTLVLIDGRRMPPGDPTQPVADLNLIPSALVDSVDVMTGGAASVYGSDAIAGVVNFKMKHNFEGLQIDAQYDFGEHDNDNKSADALNKAAGFNAPTGNTIQGRTEHLTVTFGSNSADGKGNLEGYLGYINQAPVRQSAYDYANCAIGNTGPVVNGRYFATAHACSGSSNSAYGKFQGNFWTQNPATGAWSQSKATLSNNPGPAGAFVPYDSAPPGAANRTWNYAPYQYFERQDTRYQGGYFAHYQINEHITAYSDFLFEDDHSIGQLAPSGQFLNNGSNNQVSCNNPLASQAQLQALCGANAGVAGALSTPFALGYRLQGEPRDYVLNHDSFKLDEGFKGNIDDTWSYDVYAQYGKSTSSNTTEGDISKSRLAYALDAVPGKSGPVCASSAAQAQGCVPLDIFQALSAGITPQQFKYLEEDASVSGYTTEQVVSGNLVGKLGNYGVKSPWANEGVGVAFGAEYRRDYLSLSPDAATTSGDLAGASVGGTPKTQGAVTDKDIYGELNVPIVQDHFLMKDVSVDLSYRRSDYNLAGTSGTYKFGGDWEVNRDIRFRGSFARSERAPNVLELFTPNSIQNGAFNDPCAGSAVNGLVQGHTAAQCYATAKNLAAQGVTLAQFEQNYFGNIGACPAGQCNVQDGGDTHLRPEIADTTTFGFVTTPHWLRGFYASVDYWDVNLKNALQPLPANSILNGCLANTASALCNLINRDPTTGGFIGSQGYVVTHDTNIGSVHKRGYDIQMDYRFRLKDIGLPDWGSINNDFSGTYLINDVTEIPHVPSYNCAGLFGNICSALDQAPDPRWRHKYRVTWSTPWKVDFSLQWRYIAGVKADVDSSNPVLQSANPTFVDAKIPSYSYFDLAAAWRVKDNITLRLGVNNLFDKDPPIIDTSSYPLTTGAGNTYPGSYDPLGRTLFINLTAKY